MLYSGALYSQRVRFVGGGALSSGRGAVRNLTIAPRLDCAMFQGGFLAVSSVPVGLSGGKALTMALTAGGMACRVEGSGSFTATLGALANMSANLTGSGSGSANLAAGVNMLTNLTGSGNFTAGLGAKADLRCTIAIGAQPSADDIAEAVIGKIISGSTQPNTLADALKKTLKRDEFIGLS